MQSLMGAACILDGGTADGWRERQMALVGSVCPALVAQLGAEGLDAFSVQREAP